MNFSHKLTCLLVLVLALALGLGGCVLIYGDFADRLAEAQTANARTHDAACRDVETRLIDGARYILIRAEEGVEVNGIQLQL